MVKAKIDNHRERAERLRFIALDVRGDDNSKFVLEMAAEYERMAANRQRARRGN